MTVATLRLPDARSARPHGALRLRKRADLIECPQQFRGSTYWLIKDPVALTYTHLRETEYAVLQQLDGRRSAAEICDALQPWFTPDKLTPRALQAFTARLHREGLIVSEATGQGRELQQRRQQTRRRQFRQSWANPLAIRFPGWDPGPALDRCYPALRWLFSPPAMMAYLAIVLLAALRLVTNYQQDVARLPSLNGFLVGENILWLLLIIGVTKVLHECGHALACRHFGARCTEVGLMLLVFAPCLYCNVTDAWTLSNKWQRMAISAAGILVELLLAAMAALVWSFTQEGLLNTLALNLMIVSSLNTVLLNGNPLLRYDGYFVLADWLEIPNLWSHSRAWIASLLRRFYLGWETPPAWSLDPRALVTVAIYAVFSVTYRLLVLAFVLWMLFHWLDERGLGAAGQVLVAGTLLGLIAGRIMSGIDLINNPQQRRDTRWIRLAWRSGATIGLVSLLLWVPLPRSVYVPARVTAADGQPLRVTVPGTVRPLVSPGTRVRKGDVIARLENLALEREAIMLEQEASQARLKLQRLERIRSENQELAQEIPATRQQLLGAEARLLKLQEELDALLLTAPCDGVVIDPPRVPAEVADDSIELPSWSGTPLAPENDGAFLEEDTLVCLVGDPSSYEVMMFAPQEELTLLQTGQRVDLQLVVLPGTVLRGRLAELDRRSMNGSYLDLRTLEYVLPVTTDDDGRTQLLDIRFRARVELDEPASRLRIGAAGSAKVHVQRQSLWQRLVRKLHATLRLER